MSFCDVLHQMQKDKSPVIVYGAGNTADTLLEFLEKEYFGLHIIGCAVSETVPDGKLLRGVPVKNIDEYVPYRDSGIVLVAVVDKYIPDIMERLESLRFSNIKLLSFESNNWEDLRERYFIEKFKLSGIEYLPIKDALKMRIGSSAIDSAVNIYMACSHVDKEIKERFCSKDTDFLLPIQVGKALTDKSIAAIQDNNGMNISDKNKAYSELTALYWIWKNVSAEWVGLCHYRRHFDLSFEEVCQIPNLSADIILTTPILNFPSVQAVYYRDHDAADWEEMMNVLGEMYPQYLEAAKELFRGDYYCGYNMFIAKKNVIDDYCAWLFPLLEKIEECHSSHETDYQKRYIGFLAERLFSLYFLSGINKHRVLYAHKRFYM